MTTLDRERISDRLSPLAGERLDKLDVFAEIDSTNSYLMRLAAPPAGRMHVAATMNQTAGRGRRGRRWTSPPGSGVCLSIAYTYAATPHDMPAMTLAIGIAAVAALEELGFDGLMLKWPNDLVVNGGKLGGILTEAQQQSMGQVTVVAGIGVNVDLPERIEIDEGSHWATHIGDLKSLGADMPPGDTIAAALVSGIAAAFVEFGERGFQSFVSRWPRYDWLRGRRIAIDEAGVGVKGIAAGVAEDGSLLVETESMGKRMINSGSVSLLDGARQ